MNIIQKIGDMFDSYVSVVFLERDSHCKKNHTKALIHARVTCYFEIKLFKNTRTKMGLFFIPLYIYSRIILIAYPKAFNRLWKKKYTMVSTKKPDISKVDSHPFEDLGIGN